MLYSYGKKYILQPLYKHFTAGETIKSLQNKIINLEKQNLHPIVDYIKEGSDSRHVINNNILEYIKLANVPEIDYIALKLSSIGFHEQKIEYLVENLIKKNKKVMIDAEEDKYQDKIIEISNYLITKYNSKEINIYKTYQMYRKDGLSILQNDVNNINNLGIKLVRGAYYNQDYKSGKLFINKKQTDIAFDNAMDLIFNDVKFSNTHAFICTHNKNNINKLISFVTQNKLNNKLSHASLYGFITKDTQNIINSEISTYKYLPYGKFDDSIPYLTRRIYENPKVLLHLLK